MYYNYFHIIVLPLKLFIYCKIYTKKKIKTRNNKKSNIFKNKTLFFKDSITKYDFLASRGMFILSSFIIGSKSFMFGHAPLHQLGLCFSPSEHHEFLFISRYRLY